MTPALHEQVASLAFLLGTWQGEGRGGFPSIEAFAYREELVFEHVGDPFLLYRQESWSLSDGVPLHFERGFLRPGEAPGSLELCLAHPLGLTEVAHGTLAARTIELTATAGGIGHTTTGADVTGLARRYRVDGDTLTYELDMATAGTPLTRHLDATLRRVLP
jgi:THAP4-like, heme-binding beta-barrel domain